MKKLLCSTVACAAIAVGAPAIAADVPVARAPAPVYAPGPNWTGFYFGAAFGGGWTHLDASSVSSSTSTDQSTNFTPTGAVDSFSTSTSSSNSASSASGSKFGGAFADLMIGYSALVSPGWVAGIQLEGTLSDMVFHADGTRTESGSSSNTFTALPPFPFTSSSSSSFNSTNTTEFAVKMHWATAAIARLGWLVTPTTLFYGTGGVTYAGFGDGFNSDTFRAWGWSAGGGVEQKLGSNWSVRVEYRFTDFQERTLTTSGSNSSTNSSVNRDALGAVTGTSVSTGTNASQSAIRYDPQMHTVRLGVVYTFN